MWRDRKLVMKISSVSHDDLYKIYSTVEINFFLLRYFFLTFLFSRSFSPRLYLLSIIWSFSWSELDRKFQIYLKNTPRCLSQKQRSIVKALWIIKFKVILNFYQLILFLFKSVECIRNVTKINFLSISLRLISIRLVYTELKETNIF